MRNTIQIKIWMLHNNIKCVDIQRAFGMRSMTQAWGTINGDRSDRRVLAWLLEHGCPARYLDLPGDMREAA